MDLEQLQGIASAVLLVATIISTALVGVLFGSTKTLRETVTDRGVRIDDLEKEVARAEARATEAESESRLLKTMVTGKVELIALGDLLDEHHKQAITYWTRIGDRLEQVPEKIVEAIRREEKKP